jgi:hypothetical protein
MTQDDVILVEKAVITLNNVLLNFLRAYKITIGA